MEDRPPVAYTIRVGAEIFPLRPGDTLLGRGASCHIGLDGPLVSRTHARVTLVGSLVTVTDLGSRNGVWIRGRRIQRPTTISAGEEFVLGDVQLQLLACDDHSTPDAGLIGDLRSARTVTVDVPAEILDLSPPPTPDDATRSSQAFEILGILVDKTLALGRSQEAVKLLAPPLERLLAELLAGRPVPGSVCDTAASYLTRLAEATLDGQWLNQAVLMFTCQKRPLPQASIDRLYGCLRKLRGCDWPQFRSYVEMLQSRAEQLSASERFALKRLEGLVRLSSL